RSLIPRKYGAVLLGLSRCERGATTEPVPTQLAEDDARADQIISQEYAHLSDLTQHMMRTGIREQIRARRDAERPESVRAYDLLDIVRLSYVANLARTEPMGLTNLAHHIPSDKSERVRGVLRVHDRLVPRLDRRQRRTLSRNFPNASIV
ncbi:MAG: hypothetical protein AAB834_02875, partial [Patescibacteria group bacterium]